MPFYQCRKNYDSELHRYDTTWAEINVACEACHGAASNHIELVKNGLVSKQNHGFPFNVNGTSAWRFIQSSPTAVRKGSKHHTTVDMCGRCHSLRTQLTQSAPGDSYHQTYRLQLLQDNIYFVDGQIKEESYVLGSFLQSKMYREGVTCLNCHDPHSGKLLAPKNKLCEACHRAGVYDTPVHHHHERESEGAICMNCHMPIQTYMQVDDRRDHSFTIPRPQLSMDLGVPNACASCHQQDNQWVNEKLTKWGVSGDNEHWGYVNNRIVQGDLTVYSDVARILNEEKLSAIVKASLIEQFSAVQFPDSSDVTATFLADSHPLIRRAAVRSLSGLSAAKKWPLLKPYLADPNPAVRFETIAVLADIVNYLPSTFDEVVRRVMGEYRAWLRLTEDTPTTQVDLANFELQQGNHVVALTHYLNALKIEPNFLPALINLADFYRLSKQEQKAKATLEQAIAFAPDSGVAHHSYGLLLIRQEKLTEALVHLELATQQKDAVSRFFYVYAVALDTAGNTKKTIDILQNAHQRWPNQVTLLLALVFYLEKMGEQESIKQYILQLQQIAPDLMDVRRLVEKYNLD